MDSRHLGESNSRHPAYHAGGLPLAYRGELVPVGGIEPPRPHYEGGPLPLRLDRRDQMMGGNVAESAGVEPARPFGLVALAPRCLAARPTLRSPSAANPKFAPELPRVGLRTSGSKRHWNYRVASVLRFRSSHRSVLQIRANFGIGTLARIRSRAVPGAIPRIRNGAEAPLLEPVVL